MFLGGSQRIIPDIIDLIFFGFWILELEERRYLLYDTTAGYDCTDGEEQIYKSGMGDEKKWKAEEVCGAFLRIPSFLLDGFDDLVLVVYIYRQKLCV